MKVKGDRNLCPKHFPLQVQIRNLNQIMMINNVIQLRGDDRTIAINPRTTKINAHTTGFFLTQSSDEVKRQKLTHNLPFSTFLTFFRAFHFCKACHEDVRDENLIKKCKCKSCEYGNPFLPNSALIRSMFSGRHEDNLDTECIQAK